MITSLDCIRKDGALTAERLNVLQELGKSLGKILHCLMDRVFLEENFQIFTENKITGRILRGITFPVL